MPSLGGHRDGSSVCVPAIHMRILDWVPGFWVQLGPALAVVGIWGVNLAANLSLCLFFFFSDSQRQKQKTESRGHCFISRLSPSLQCQHSTWLPVSLSCSTSNAAPCPSLLMCWVNSKRWPRSLGCRTHLGEEKRLQGADSHPANLWP